MGPWHQGPCSELRPRIDYLGLILVSSGPTRLTRLCRWLQIDDLGFTIDEEEQAQVLEPRTAPV